jgi:outer membrane protein assembly factor BamB
MRVTLIALTAMVTGLLVVGCGGQAEEDATVSTGQEVVTTDTTVPEPSDVLVWLGQMQTMALDAEPAGQDGWLVLCEAVEPRQYSYVQLFRVNADGEVIWSTDYVESDLEPSDLLATSDGNFIIAASESPTWDELEMASMEAGELEFTDEDGNVQQLEVTAPSADFWIRKIDSQGKDIWHRQYVRETDNYCTTVLECANGDLVLVGTVFEEEPMIRVLRTDPAGNPIWDRTYGSSAGLLVEGAAITASGNVIMGSVLNSPSPEGRVIELMAVDPDGDELWRSFHGRSPGDQLYALAETHQGNIAMVGRSPDSSGTDQAFLALVDQEGNSFSTLYYDHEGFYDVFVPEQGGLLVSAEGTAIGMDDDGEVLWSATMDEITGSRTDRVLPVSENTVLLLGSGYPPEELGMLSDGPIGYLALMEH